ncbi:hypothetical protein INR49_019487 [Caranx melampygus]|nr:hypothetical protein INR49_019487 [Caranx melampygus]
MTPPPPTPAAEVRTVQVAGRATDRPTVQWERGLALVRCRDWPARLRGCGREITAADPADIWSSPSRESELRAPSSIPHQHTSGSTVRSPVKTPPAPVSLLRLRTDLQLEAAAVRGAEGPCVPVKTRRDPGGGDGLSGYRPDGSCDTSGPDRETDVCSGAVVLI